ncbi:MAG TPA: polysaccharide deacetylase family protein [Chitinophagaceae bacterium]
MVPIDEFHHQMMVLKQLGYTTITCQELSAFNMKMNELPPQPVMITFDEGHVSQSEYVTPILEEFKFTATFFIPAAVMLKSTVGEEDFKDKMNIDQLRFLQEKGFEVALQGYSGLDFSICELNAIGTDIERSIALFKKLQFPVTRALAYPNGAQPRFFWKKRKLYEILRKHGIVLAFDTTNKINDLSAVERFSVHRIEVKGTDSAEAFTKKLNPGKLQWLVGRY